MCHCISSGRDTVGGIARTGASVVAERHATGRWRLRGQEQSVLDGHRDHVHERRAVRQFQARPAAALLVTAVEQVPAPRLHQHHARYSSLQWSKFQHRDCTNITLSFKRVLLQRYSSLQWSKFQHRDCTNITLESGKTATVHMWQQDKRSVWLSGDGNQDWYNNEFQELHADAVVGKVPSGTLISIMHRFVFDGSHSVFVSLTFVLLNLACAC